MTIDNPGRGRTQRRETRELRFERARASSGDQLEIHHAIRFRIPADRVQPRDFFFAQRNDELFASRIGYAVIVAECIKAFLALNAEPRSKAARSIIYAGVDHFGIA